MLKLKFVSFFLPCKFTYTVFNETLKMLLKNFEST
jgi:hypothetical protein